MTVGEVLAPDAVRTGLWLAPDGSLAGDRADAKCADQTASPLLGRRRGSVLIESPSENPGANSPWPIARPWGSILPPNTEDSSVIAMGMWASVLTSVILLGVWVVNR